MVRTRVGYAGGTLGAPTYHHLGDHTEAFQVDFDPTVTTYAALLALFWESHAPQRPSSSRQYDAALFPDGPAQLAQARESLAQVQARLRAPVQTRLEPLGRFHRAEDYHQKYLLRRTPELLQELAGYDARALTDSTVAARLNALAGGHAVPDALDSYGLTPRGLERARRLLRAAQRG